MILGFIGTGKISSSIIFGIFKSKLKVKKIYISSRNRNIAKKLTKKYRKITVLIIFLFFENFNLGKIIDPTFGVTHKIIVEDLSIIS